MIQSTNLSKDMMMSSETMINPAVAEKSSTVKVTSEETNMKNSQGESQNNNQFSKQSIDKAVKEINKKLENSEKKLEYSVHERTNKILIKVIDTKTEEVIREVPDEKLMDMIADMCEASGLLIDKKI